MTVQGPTVSLDVALIQAAAGGQLNEFQRVIPELFASVNKTEDFIYYLEEAFLWAAATGSLDIIKFMLTEEFQSLISAEVQLRALKKSIIYGRENVRDLLLPITKFKLEGVYPNSDSNSWCDHFAALRSQEATLGEPKVTKVFIPNFTRLKADLNKEKQNGFYVGEVFCPFIDEKNWGLKAPQQPKVT